MTKSNYHQKRVLFDSREVTPYLSELVVPDQISQFWIIKTVFVTSSISIHNYHDIVLKILICYVLMFMTTTLEVFSKKSGRVDSP